MNMDNISMFLNAQDLSLQEMLDTDMKIEIDNVFGPSDMSLSLSDLPPLDLDESLGGPSDMPMWFTSSGLGASGYLNDNCNSNSSNNSHFNLDLVGNDGAGKMVDPTSVIPCMNGTNGPINGNGGSIQYFNRNSYIIEDSPGSLSSPDMDEEPFTPPEVAPANGNLKYVTSLSVLNPIRQNIRVANFSRGGDEVGVLSSANGVVKTLPIVQQAANGTTKILGHAVSKMQHIQISGVRTLNGTLQHQPHYMQQQQQQQQVNKVKHAFGGSAKQFHHNQQSTGEADYEDHRAYPKPAYSYSCLIAMALKNSAMGSLPVSEIYNFMCEHFPYFKTAPNGWKNSVRHNLSLNKCFEKIEKPVGNGSQRKGCLWAMNPSKIAKMDEEVQKWSKKDPMAIKKAMINPGALDSTGMTVSNSKSIGLSEDIITENLELLERGELKREFAGGLASGRSPGGSLSGDGEDSEDLEEDDEDGAMSSPATPAERFVDVGGSSVTTAGASSDEGSLNDFDVEVADTLYDELQRDEKLNLGVTFTSTVPKELLGISLANSVISSSPSRLLQAQQPSFANKRAKISTSIHGNYVYKPMTGGWDSADRKRKPPLLLRGSNGSIGSSLIKVEDSL